ncbi:AraC family transcriptional regulator [uncultured Alistipes sp.]|uniref:helix-turn-helix domain-containing protein n=1 Tax=uncultured Alistipes sp. TaxID=538949 RepID=UPI002729A08D|nr:AraC family transcriptional regulator [uncultured Alistipes sp.]
MNEVTTPRRSSALFYYLIANDYDRSLNAVVNAVGSQEIAAGDEYPLHVHPADYYFDMQKGRVLHEYQLLYVTQGKGTFRSAAGPSEGVTVEKGTMILLRPGELHSYCPDTSTGWTEYYIGFEGAAFDRLIDRLGLGKGQQVWPIGLHSELTQLYRRAIEIAADNKTAPQPLLAGIVQHMIGLLNYLLRNRTGHATDLLEQSVEKAKIIMDERVSGEIDLYDLASELNLSYSWFRKTFKEYTGHSPARYFQLLKLRRAQRLLSDTELSIKEIAYSLGYKSTEHFFSIFKKHTGCTPTAYRNYGRK